MGAGLSEMAVLETGCGWICVRVLDATLPASNTRSEFVE